MNWIPIDLQKHKVQRTAMAWSETTVDCYNSNKDCANCPNLKATESLLPWYMEEVTKSTWGVSEHKHIGCKVPITIQKLLNRGVLPYERSFYSARK